MNCYDCAFNGIPPSAVATCLDCGAGLCLDHAVVSPHHLTHGALEPADLRVNVEPPLDRSTARRAPPHTMSSCQQDHTEGFLSTAPNDVLASGPDGETMNDSVPRIGPLDWASWKTRFVLFTGKGGVGKTTVASGVAVALADAGLRVLLVSTDPASNLADVFQTVTGENRLRLRTWPAWI